jgi:hypothetical protein
MAFNLLVWSGRNGRNMVYLVDAGPGASAGGSANPPEAGSRANFLQTLKALGAGGGTRTPTTFVTGT